MSSRVILYHSRTCQPCVRFITSGDWNNVQSMCNDKGLGVTFMEYEYTKDKKKFEEKNVDATPTIEVINGGKSYFINAEPPEKLFETIQSKLKSSKKTGAIQMGGSGKSAYYEKYLKYKNKYIALKMST